MHIPVSFVVVAVLATASLSTPAVSETSEHSFSNLDENSQPVGERERLLQVNDEASDVLNEERVRPPIEINPSVVSQIEHPEPHAAIPNMANEHDMALIRDHDVAKCFETEIDIRTVGTSLTQLRELPITSGVDNYKLILMAIGDELLKTRFPDDTLKSFQALAGFSVMSKLMGDELFEKWRNLLSQSSFSIIAIFDMMRYLIGKTDGITMDLRVYGYMAIGRVLLSSPKIAPWHVPNLPTLTPMEKLSMQRGVNPSKTKLWLERLKGQEQNSGKDEDVLLSEALNRAMGDYLSLGRGK